jgi:uncharacterized peroxidase-related enzyme
MARIEPIQLAQATGEARELLQGVERQLGKVPNVFKVMALSPPILKGYLEMSRSVTDAGLDPGLREQIAVAVAGINRCDYCASAHTAVGKKRGVSAPELDINLQARSENIKTGAVFGLVKAILNRKGEVTDVEIDALRDAGFSDRQLVELIIYIGLSATANYLNKIARTEIDFPLVRTTE